MTPRFRITSLARSRGTFGNSKIGRFFEFVTTTWFRFEFSLIWVGCIVVAFLAFFSTGVEMADRLVGLAAMIIFSPISAIMIWMMVKAAGIILYFIPGAGMIWAWSRFAFYRTFSRLVVEQAPTIVIPAWKTW